MKFNLSAESARKVLVLLWFLFFFLNFAILFYLYFDRWIGDKNFKAAVYQINASYVTYLGVMVAFYFGNLRRTTLRKPGMAFALALIGSINWNIVIFAFIFRVFLLVGKIEDAIEEVRYFGSMLSWLVAPAIGFYFANQSLPQERREGA